VVGDDNFDVTKGKSKDHYNLLIREKAKPPNIIQKLQSNFHFNSDNLKQIFKLLHSIVVESYVKAFQYKVVKGPNALGKFLLILPKNLSPVALDKCAR